MLSSTLELLVNNPEVMRATLGLIDGDQCIQINVIDLINLINGWEERRKSEKAQLAIDLISEVMAREKAESELAKADRANCAMCSDLKHGNGLVDMDYETQSILRQEYDGTYVLHVEGTVVTGNNVTFTTQVRYCPLCGRKLES